MWFQNRRMKHKRQNLSKDEDGDHKDLKGDDDTQSDSSECSVIFLECLFHNKLLFL